MITNLCHFLFRVLSKIFGLSFSFSSDGEDAILIKYLSKIKNGNYIDIGSRTFLSSIYILENQLRHLPSDYIKLLEL